MKISILRSGSAGNCYFISDGRTRLLIDIGISREEIRDGLAAIGEDIYAIDAVLITHEHGDHAKGLASFVRSYQPKVYLTQYTGEALASGLLKTVGVFTPLFPEQITSVGTFHVLPCRVPHDSVDPVGYIILGGGVRAAFIADVGMITDAMAYAIRDVDFLFLESNHDEAMLAAGFKMPDCAKKRVGNQHLSNLQMERFVLDHLQPDVRRFVLGHISNGNNLPELVTSTAQAALQSRALTTQLSVVPPGGCSTAFLM